MAPARLGYRTTPTPPRRRRLEAAPKFSEAQPQKEPQPQPAWRRAPSGMRTPDTTSVRVRPAAGGEPRIHDEARAAARPARRRAAARRAAPRAVGFVARASGAEAHPPHSPPAPRPLRPPRPGLTSAAPRDLLRDRDADERGQDHLALSRSDDERAQHRRARAGERAAARHVAAAAVGVGVGVTHGERHARRRRPPRGGRVGRGWRARAPGGRRHAARRMLMKLLVGRELHISPHISLHLAILAARVRRMSKRSHSSRSRGSAAATAPPRPAPATRAPQVGLLGQARRARSAARSHPSAAASPIAPASGSPGRSPARAVSYGPPRRRRARRRRAVDAPAHLRGARGAAHARCASRAVLRRSHRRGRSARARACRWRMRVSASWRQQRAAGSSYRNTLGGSASRSRAYRRSGGRAHLAGASSRRTEGFLDDGDEGGEDEEAAQRAVRPVEGRPGATRVVGVACRAATAGRVSASERARPAQRGQSAAKGGRRAASVEGGRTSSDRRRRPREEDLQNGARVARGRTANTHTRSLRPPLRHGGSAAAVLREQALRVEACWPERASICSSFSGMAPLSTAQRSMRDHRRRLARARQMRMTHAWEGLDGFHRPAPRRRRAWMSGTAAPR